MANFNKRKEDLLDQTGQASESNDTKGIVDLKD